VGFTRPLAGRYRLDQPLGSGGTSEVWLGFDTLLDRPVAVKVLAPSVSGDHQARRRILAEAQATARVSHANVTVVHDYGEEVDDEGRQVPYVVMELLRGQVLAARLSLGRLPPPLALTVGAQVAAALAAAHAYGLVHRDIKPGNVMLTQAAVKVFDFGIAAPVGRLDDADLSQPIMGSAAYVAPERLSGSPVTAASDVYALGVLLFRILAHDLPWQVGSVAELVQAHVTGEPAALPELDGVPREVAGLVAACLSRQPQERPSAAEAAAVLAAAAGIAVPVSQSSPESLDLGLASTNTEPMLPRPAAVAALEPPPTRSHRGKRVAIAIAGVILLIAGLAYGASALWYQRRAPVQAGLGPGEATMPLGPGQSPGGSAPVPTGTPGPGQSGGGNLGAPGPIAGGSTIPTGSPPPKPSTPDGPPTPIPVQRTLTSAGGFVVATCVGPALSIDSVVPASGYQVDSQTLHGTTAASVVFATAGSQVRLSIACQSGVPFDTSPSRPA
jgi:eukaryotic-like serine/threonine-protein kinase